MSEAVDTLPLDPAPARIDVTPLLRIVVPVMLLVMWWAGTAMHPGGLIPSPQDVGTALWDLAFGGINDDAFSQMLLPDLIASASRVYGAFLLRPSWPCRWEC